jgi:hypothetical protein
MLWFAARASFETFLHLWLPLLSALIALLIWLVRQVRSRLAQAWPVMDGTVESARVLVDGFGHTERVIPAVNYSFSVNGEYYAGVHVESGESQFVFFPKGARVLVHYKPSDPSISFLDREDVRSRKRRTSMQ